MKKKVLVLLATVALLALLMPACIVPAATPTPVPIAANWVMKVEVSDLIPQVTQPKPDGGDIRFRWRNYSSTGDFVGTIVCGFRGDRPATALATPATGIPTVDGFWTFSATYKPGTPEQRSGFIVYYMRFTYDAAKASPNRDLKGEWRIVSGTQDFVNLSGQGTMWESATETYTHTGQVSFGPK